MEDSKVAYKAFDKNLQCRGYQFEIGKTYKHMGKVEICSSGFHSCLNPFDVLNYYDLIDCRFAVVDASGDIATHEEDSKIASAEITIKEELHLPEFINKCVKYIAELCTDCASEASGDYSQLAASGDNSQLAASGNSSQLAASGGSSKLAASGGSSKLAASGHYSQLVASGDYSRLAAPGDSSVACNAGLNGRVKGGRECAMSLVYFDGGRYRIVVAYVGENGIKQDVWYRLNDKAQFSEVV